MACTINRSCCARNGRRFASAERMRPPVRRWSHRALGSPVRPITRSGGRYLARVHRNPCRADRSQKNTRRAPRPLGSSSLSKVQTRPSAVAGRGGKACLRRRLGTRAPVELNRCPSRVVSRTYGLLTLRSWPLAFWRWHRPPRNRRTRECRWLDPGRRSAPETLRGFDSFSIIVKPCRLTLHG